MPLKNGKPHCVNHLEDEMVLLNQKNPKLHTTVVLSELDDKGMYTVTNYCTGMNFYACKICGYCESYLVPNELNFYKNN